MLIAHSFLFCLSFFFFWSLNSWELQFGIYSKFNCKIFLILSYFINISQASWGFCVMILWWHQRGSSSLNEDLSHGTLCCFLMVAMWRILKCSSKPFKFISFWHQLFSSRVALPNHLIVPQHTSVHEASVFQWDSFGSCNIQMVFQLELQYGVYEFLLSVCHFFTFVSQLWILPRQIP